MTYVPGITHRATDAISRKPAGSISPQMIDLPDDIDTSMIKDDLYALKSFLTLTGSEDRKGVKDHSAINALTSIQTVTWEKEKPELKSLTHFINSGFPSCKAELTAKVQPYFQHRKHLSIADDVILYKDRVVIPDVLRQAVLSTLHSAHHGLTRMTARAGSYVFCPI